MKTLNHTFLILQIIGMWRPVHWLPGWKTKLYDFYTGFMIFLIVTVAITEFIELVNSFGDVAAVASNSFILLTMIADCGKGANILKKRSEIIELTNILQDDPCRPKSKEEFAIQRKFDRMVRSNTLCYAALIGFTVIAVLMGSFVQDIPRRALPFKSWLPFDCYESILGYSIAYSHQVVSFTAGGILTAAFDTLVPGLMLQTCAQLNILKCRLHDMSEIIKIMNKKINYEGEINLLNDNLESKLLGQCIKHHIQIFKFAEKSNDLFGIMVLVQYTISTLVLCMSIFELSKMKWFSAEFTSLLIYLICVGIQIFIYCYYGCEVTLESLAVGDAVYESDWTYLSINTKRSLLMVMARTLRPITYTSAHVVTLNLDYFNSLLKFSYSAYNVLQQSSDREF